MSRKSGTKRAALAQLQWECDHGKGDDPVVLIDVKDEQERKIKNDARSTRFVVETDDPDMCSALQFEKHRIVTRIKNKAIAISLIHRALRDALSNAELDKIAAELEMQP